MTWFPGQIGVLITCTGSDTSISDMGGPGTQTIFDANSSPGDVIRITGTGRLVSNRNAAPQATLTITLSIDGDPLATMTSGAIPLGADPRTVDIFFEFLLTIRSIGDNAIIEANGITLLSGALQQNLSCGPTDTVLGLAEHDVNVSLSWGALANVTGSFDQAVIEYLYAPYEDDSSSSSSSSSSS